MCLFRQILICLFLFSIIRAPSSPSYQTRQSYTHVSCGTGLGDLKVWGQLPLYMLRFGGEGTSCGHGIGSEELRTPRVLGWTMCWVLSVSGLHTSSPGGWQHRDKLQGLCDVQYTRALDHQSLAGASKFRKNGHTVAKSLLLPHVVGPRSSRAKRK